MTATALPATRWRWATTAVAAIPALIVVPGGASFVGSLVVTIARELDPGCQSAGLVTCVVPDVNITGRYVGIAAGVLLTIVLVAVRSRWAAVSAGTLAVLTTAAGMALILADQARWNQPRLAICIEAANGCAYPPVETADLVRYGVLGALLGLGVVALARIGRRAS